MWFLAYNDQIRFLDRLKLITKAMKGLPPDCNLGKALAAALTERQARLDGLQKEQEPVIAASIAARESERGSVCRRLQGLGGAHGA